MYSSLQHVPYLYTKYGTVPTQLDLNKIFQKANLPDRFLPVSTSWEPFLKPELFSNAVKIILEKILASTSDTNRNFYLLPQSIVGFWRDVFRGRIIRGKILRRRIILAIVAISLGFQRTGSWSRLCNKHGFLVDHVLRFNVPILLGLVLGHKMILKRNNS